jgi:transposase-like protein
MSEDQTMSTRRYQRHSTEFKVRLVQSYLAGEGTIKGLARQHGVYHSLLRQWVDKYRKGHFDEKEVVVEKVEEYEAKIAALERKVGQLTMEVDILKKLRERTSPPEGTPSVISGPAASPSSKDAKS